MLLSLRPGESCAEFQSLEFNPYVLTVKYGSAIEMNVAIMVSCAASLPSFFVKTNIYLRSATSSLRNRILSFVELRSISRRSSVEREDLDPYIEIQEH